MSDADINLKVPNFRYLRRRECSGPTVAASSRPNWRFLADEPTGRSRGRGCLRQSLREACLEAARAGIPPVAT